MATTRREKNDISDQVSTITKDVKAATRQIATDGVEALRATTSQYMDEGRERVREWGETFESRIHDQPLKSILVAAAVGFLFGVLMRRR